MGHERVNCVRVGNGVRVAESLEMSVIRPYPPEISGGTKWQGTSQDGVGAIGVSAIGV